MVMSIIDLVYRLVVPVGKYSSFGFVGIETADSVFVGLFRLNRWMYYLWDVLGHCGQMLLLH